MSFFNSFLASAQDAYNEISTQATQLAADISTQAQEHASKMASNLENLSLDDIAEKIITIPGSITMEEQKLSGTHAKPKVSILPWATVTEEKSILCQDVMEKVLQLSTDPENFTSSPASSSPEEQALFDFQAHVDIILKLMEIDPNLGKVQARLATKVPEETFWGNYFARVALLRVEAGLEPLAASVVGSRGSNEQQAAMASAAGEGGGGGEGEGVHGEGAPCPAAPAPAAASPTPASEPPGGGTPSAAAGAGAAHPAAGAAAGAAGATAAEAGAGDKEEEEKDGVEVDILDEDIEADLEGYDIGSDISDLDEGLVDAELEAEIALELEESDI